MPFKQAKSSSNIAEYSYNGDTNKLCIKFKSGKYYRYDDVPVNVYRDFELSKSLGTYLNQNIKNTYQVSEISSNEAHLFFGTSSMISPFAEIDYSIFASSTPDSVWI